MSISELILLLVITPAQAEDIHSKVDHYANQYQIPAFLAHEIISKESRYNPTAHKKDFYGLGQIKCVTAKEIGLKGNCEQLFQIDTNLIYSMRYLRLALDKAKQDHCKAKQLYQKGLYTKKKIRC